ncbi:MAG: hypothetical protein HRT47_06555 [Candidatus Caenarcaniphilales bacterium]|nr:hypothetical protein [Candidatus Caenarcaniphilales bacterium]
MNSSNNIRLESQNPVQFFNGASNPLAKPERQEDKVRILNEIKANGDRSLEVVALNKPENFIANQSLAEIISSSSIFDLTESTAANDILKEANKNVNRSNLEEYTPHFLTMASNSFINPTIFEGFSIADFNDFLTNEEDNLSQQSDKYKQIKQLISKLDSDNKSIPSLTEEAYNYEKKEIPLSQIRLNSFELNEKEPKIKEPAKVIQNIKELADSIDTNSTLPHSNEKGSKFSEKNVKLNLEKLKKSLNMLEETARALKR